MHTIASKPIENLVSIMIIKLPAENLITAPSTLEGATFQGVTLIHT